MSRRAGRPDVGLEHADADLLVEVDDVGHQKHRSTELADIPEDSQGAQTVHQGEGGAGVDRVVHSCVVPDRPKIVRTLPATEHVPFSTSPSA